LQVQDVIVAVDNTPLDDSHSLFTVLLQYHPGDTIKVKVMRGDKEQTLTLTLTERPADLQ